MKGFHYSMLVFHVITHVFYIFPFHNKAIRKVGKEREHQIRRVRN